MSEIKLDAEQEREARELAAELWQRASVCEDIADEVIALRRVAEAAEIAVTCNDLPRCRECLKDLGDALNAAGRLP